MRGMPSLGGSWCRGGALVVCVWSFTDDMLICWGSVSLCGSNLHVGGKRAFRMGCHLSVNDTNGPLSMPVRHLHDTVTVGS